MAWVRVPPEHHPIFRDALPRDPRVETMAMFGGVAAKVNGHVFAGLFGRSTMLWLPEAQRAEALALEGAAPFDPMGDGRARSDKVMLPESMMDEPDELRRWIARAFAGAQALPQKAAKTPAEKAAKAAPSPGAKASARAPAQAGAKKAAKPAAAPRKRTRK
jgi:TfoX/Sxy family transcriptional regulator of competence genes